MDAVTTNSSSTKSATTDSWHTVCDKKDLVPHTGVCAKVRNNQVAIFYCQRSDEMYALSNYDPIGQASVISRGIMGSVKGEPCVASPLYKQHFSLKTGICIESPEHKLARFDVRESKGKVQVRISH